MDRAHLIAISGQDGTLENGSFPGFWAIGTGAANAMFWLAHRGQMAAMRPLRAAYHAYEAKLMAEDAPNVNEHMDILIANATQFWRVGTHYKPGPHAHSHITIERLKELCQTRATKHRGIG